MRKKIIVGIAILSLLGVLLVGCANNQTTQSNSTGETSPSANNSSLTTSAPSVVTSASHNNSGGISALESNTSGTSDTIQSNLPLTVTEPVDASTINGDSVMVQGTTAPGAVVNVDGTIVTADSTGAFSTNVSLNTGLNAIDVIATDDNNNQGEVLLLVNAVPSSTTTAPGNAASSPGTLPLTVTQPLDSATVNTSTVTVQGQTAPGATVTVNGNSDLADENGDFSINVSLSKGLNAIDVVAMDDNGNQGEVLLMVNDTNGS